MGATLKSRNVVVLMLAASLASTIGGLPFNTLPVLLGSLADSFSLPPEQVGLLGSICFGGYLLGTLGAPIWMNRLNWRWLTVVGAMGTALCFALSAMVQALPLLYVSWACIGFFASTMTCLGMRVLSDLPNKERAFGVRQGVELSVTAAVLFALPPLVIARFHYAGAAWALAALILLLGLSAFWVPGGAQARLISATDALASQPQRMPVTAWWALAVLWLFLVGNIGLWAFLERIGVHLSVSATDMGVVFAVLKLLGSVAAFFIAGVGARWSLARGLSLALLGLMAGLGLLASATGFGFYAAGAWLWEFAFTCGCVLQTAHIARTDPSGRAIMLVPGAFALASMVGPGVAGKLMGAQGLEPVLWFALASSVVPVLNLLWSKKSGSNRPLVHAG
ncbi:MFS transporter [Comamonas sp. lk]|uniref:MFS transporter n=1 Tax=Comamonas sp. lk TaxID=2201272 RepID=UPI000EAC113F|nr:MFS transporter [Comamonas sp. lk]